VVHTIGAGDTRSLIGGRRVLVRDPRARAAAGLVLGVGLVVVVIASFLPWMRSGAHHRSSYSLVAVARRIHVIDNAALSALARLWPLAPMLAAGAVLALIRERPRTAALLGATVSVATIFLVIAVKTAPVAAEGGATTALVGAIMALIGSVAVLMTRPRRPTPLPGAKDV
jgi:hypothetical protein